MEDDVFIGEVRLFAFTRCPSGWLPCDGTLHKISNHTALFTLLGTAFGGDGKTTFGVPDLRGRVPIHRSDTYKLGEQVGLETVTLETNNLPSHSHDFQVSGLEGSEPPAHHYPGTASPKIGKMYGPTANASMAACIGFTGNAEPHENRQPFVTMNYLIAAEGAYPS